MNIPTGELEIHTIDTHEEILRQQSEDVPLDIIPTDKFQTFLDNLHKTMIEVELPPNWMPGGISAVQVGIHLNLFYIYNANTDNYDLLINPKVELLGSSQDLRTEGCLSIPDATGDVKRYKRVRVEYIDRNGETHRKKHSGWNARVIQHEYDHLLGILFTDKLA